MTKRGRPSKPLAQKMAELVDRRGPDECWPWKGARNALGYGLVMVTRPDGTRFSQGAHRAAYELASGAGAGELVVRHYCDNPLCCNPAHLVVGTQADNYQDMVSRGRADWQRGHKRRFAPRFNKLTDDTVRLIRLLYADGEQVHKIAYRVGCSEPHVIAVARRRRKAHVPDVP